MFSGLVQDLSKVVQSKDQKVIIQTIAKKTRRGESIAVNGVCLTVTTIQKKGRSLRLSFDVSPETLRKTNLGVLRPGDAVNLERCLTLSDLLGGHLVQGHVDGVGKVVKIVELGDNKEIWFEGPPMVLKYVVPKGSVAVNGVSLTAVEVTDSIFSVALIPYTLDHTNLGQLKLGDVVNLEADVIAKYVEKFTSSK